MRIVFDCDGVLADFYRGFQRLARDLFGPLEESLDWTWDNYGLDLTKDQVARVWDRIKQDQEFWLNLKPLITLEDRWRIRGLVSSHDVYFVSSRVGKHPKRQTELWLCRVLDLSCPTVIISSRKGEICAGLEADYSIDDKAGNAVYISYHSPRTRSFLLDAPYNRFAHDVIGSRVRRVRSVSEFLDAIEGPRDSLPLGRGPMVEPLGPA